jgi:hypothetical protein
MLSLLSSLFGIVPAITGTITNITNAIRDKEIALINAKTDMERIAVSRDIAQLQAQAAVLEAESKISPMNIYIRTAFALCALIPVAKLLVWDKVVGAFVGCVGRAGEAASCASFNTDKFSNLDAWIITTCVVFYFVGKGR